MKKIILASKSPRRIDMLKKYVRDLSTYSPNIEEKVKYTDSPQTTVMKIAFEKADEVLNRCSDEGIIISADTIVYSGEILGKPKNYNDGYRMLRHLSGRIHNVYTGLCVMDNTTGNKVIDYEVTKVEFNDLSDEFIYRYLNTGEYKDKAGAYGIQGYGELLVKGISGCYNNVKGLPINKLNSILKKYFSIEFL